MHLEAIKALARLLYPRGLDSMFRGAMEPFLLIGVAAIDIPQSIIFCRPLLDA